MTTDPLASRTVGACRACGSRRLEAWLDLGRTPLANSYLDAQTLKEPEFAEELKVQLCRDCGLSSLTKAVPPDRLFRHYLYVSSTTETMRAHFAGLARAAAAAAGARAGDLALDVASNDGTLLAAFRASGLAVLGVDPARNLAAEANAKGLRTWPEYWSPAVAARAVRELGRAKVVTAANVLAHVDDLAGSAEAVAAVLAPGGVFAAEFPSVVDLVENGAFDTVYHEHVSYLALGPLDALLRKRGLALFDAERFPSVHGGTVRAWAARAGERPPTPRLESELARETDFGLKDPAVYRAFAARVSANRGRLRAELSRLRAAGKTVWAYGASAKGNTLLNYLGLTSVDVPKAVDDNPKKAGLFTPGAHLEIVGPDALARERPDVLLLLAWNFAAEIRRRCAAAGWRGDFLLPVPEARLEAAAA